MYSHIIFLHNECSVKMKVLVTRLCLTLCDPIYCSLPGSSVHGFLQARYWSELPFPSPGDLPDPGIDPRFPVLQADSLPSEPPGKQLMAYWMLGFSRSDLLKIKPSGWSLIHSGWCHCKKRLGQRETQGAWAQGDSHVKQQQKGGHLWVKERGFRTDQSCKNLGPGFPASRGMRK